MIAFFAPQTPTSFVFFIIGALALRVGLERLGKWSWERSFALDKRAIEARTRKASA